tara:strand:+ start:166 stop:489 length:324 start_codon:yes stop_codon:yes gene_type:complete
MKIKRELKHGSFEWDDETKMFKITNGEYSIELGKVYAFAFLRFVFRIAQRNWFRKMETKPKKNKGKEIICDKNIRDGKMEIEQFTLPHCEDFVKEEKEEELLEINLN